MTRPKSTAFLLHFISDLRPGPLSEMDRCLKEPTGMQPSFILFLSLSASLEKCESNKCNFSKIFALPKSFIEIAFFLFFRRKRDFGQISPCGGDKGQTLRKSFESFESSRLEVAQRSIGSPPDRHRIRPIRHHIISLCIQ